MLEYMARGDLKAAHSQQPLTEKEVLIATKQSLEALAWMHEQSVPDWGNTRALKHGLRKLPYAGRQCRDPIAHRDIKPGNILVQTRQPLFVKLADFGISKQASLLHTFCGTPVHMAPEKSSRRYFVKVDIWSLGTVALYFLWGLPSIGGPAVNQIVDRIPPAIRCKVEKIELDSDWVAPLLGNMLQIDPKVRFSARQCLAHPLLTSLIEDEALQESKDDCLESSGSGSLREEQEDSVMPDSLAIRTVSASFRDQSPRITEAWSDPELSRDRPCLSRDGFPQRSTSIGWPAVSTELVSREQATTPTSFATAKKRPRSSGEKAAYVKRGRSSTG